MALTPDDVVTKQFQHVRFKEGFDPDEVDDFLDEIVVEWRKTIAENEELKARLAEYETGERPATAERPAAPEPVSAPVPAVTAPPAASTEAAESASATATAGIIELAQRLHDEHIAEGIAQRDQLIAEAKAQAASILTEAETKGREETARLEKERGVLEARISELRQFERDYRSQLRELIESKLRELDSATTGTGSSPVSALGL